MRYTVTIDIITDLTQDEIDELIERTVMSDDYVLDGDGVIKVEPRRRET